MKCVKISVMIFTDEYITVLLFHENYISIYHNTCWIFSNDINTYIIYLRVEFVRCLMLSIVNVSIVRIKYYIKKEADK